MKKNSIFKMAARATVAACVVAALAGCSKKAPPRKVYAPLAPEGTAVAGIWEYKGLADNPMMQFLVDWVAESNAKMVAAQAEANPALAATLPQPDVASIKEKALKGLKECDWSVFTMKKPAFTAEIFKDDDAVIDFPQTVFVQALTEPLTPECFEKRIKASLEEGLASLDETQRGEMDELFAKYVAVADDTVAGCAVKKVSFKETDETKEILNHVKGLAPCYGIFDETLAIFASSPEAFAETVALYKGEAVKSTDPDIAADFGTCGKEQSRYGFYGLQGLLADFLGDDYDKFDDLAGGCVKPIRALRVAGAIDGEAMSAKGAIRLVMDDAAAAKTLSSQIENSRGMIAMGAGFLAMRAPALSPATMILNKFKTSGDDGVCAIELEATKAELEALDFAAIVEQCQEFLPQGEGEEDQGEGEE